MKQLNGEVLQLEFRNVDGLEVEEDEAVLGRVAHVHLHEVSDASDQLGLSEPEVSLRRRVNAGEGGQWSNACRSQDLPAEALEVVSAVLGAEEGVEEAEGD